MLQTVMIADDSMPLHTLIKEQFSADHLNFHSVYDGAAAVSVAATLQPNLILLDIDMPNMDGFEACRRIKADPITASIPLMFLSADSTSVDRQKAIELGALDYIKKPFRPDQLRSRVRSTLQAVPISADKAAVDPLTGLCNKTVFESNLSEQFMLAQLSSESLACVMVEIDQLGVINVRFGAMVANQTVRKVADILTGAFNEEMTLSCLPNRRFAILFRNCSRFDAAHRAEILRGILRQKLILDKHVQVDISCSFGICDNSISSATTLFDRTSKALHRAANRGGNCIAVARSSAKSKNSISQ